MTAPPNSTARVRVTRVPGAESDDVVAVEEPLEIRIAGAPVAVTMRTPGHDEELALGFCLSEGLRPLDARVPDDLAANTVEVDAPGADVGRLQRSFYTSSSCGVCGKGALEAVAVEAPRVESDLRVDAALVAQLPDRLRAGQAAFEATGGLHATGLFSADGELLCVREDVGRHNALDKVVGRAFLDGLLPLSGSILCVSGRLSFELVQKASVAGCPLLVAVGAPSSLAVELAGDRGITLCGFVRGGSLNVYTEPWRISAVTGVLLVGGASARFGSPKALARFGDETLAERAWRTLGRGVPRPARGRQGRARASVPRRRRAGGAAGAARRRDRRARVPSRPRPQSSFRWTVRSITPDAAARAGRAGRRHPDRAAAGGLLESDLPELERRLLSGDWSLRGVNPRVLEADARLLANVNTPAELSALEQDLAALDHDQA